MRKIGVFKVKEISIDSLKIGFNSIQNHIKKVDKNNNVSQVIDKVCDHAGGRLILKGEDAVCSIHNWSLNLNTLE